MLTTTYFVLQILLFHVELVEDSYQCRMVGKFRNHVSPITDLASSNTKQGKVRLVLHRIVFGKSCPGAG